MSVPFGGHPTFGQYLAWATSQGCEVQQGAIHSIQGEAYSVTKIVAPSGKKWVIDVGTQYKEYLVPTTIARLDRRLGLTSPFFSIDPDDPHGARKTPQNKNH